MAVKQICKGSGADVLIANTQMMDPFGSLLDGRTYVHVSPCPGCDAHFQLQTYTDLREPPTSTIPQHTVPVYA